MESIRDVENCTAMFAEAALTAEQPAVQSRNWASAGLGHFGCRNGSLVSAKSSPRDCPGSQISGSMGAVQVGALSGQFPDSKDVRRRREQSVVTTATLTRVFVS